MLILQRRAGESIRIGDDIEITIVATEGGRVRLAISAPSDIPILRNELIVAQEPNHDAAMEQVAPKQLQHIMDHFLPVAAAQPTSTAPIKLLTPQKKTNSQQ